MDYYCTNANKNNKERRKMRLLKTEEQIFNIINYLFFTINQNSMLYNYRLHNQISSICDNCVSNRFDIMPINERMPC